MGMGMGRSLVGPYGRFAPGRPIRPTHDPPPRCHAQPMPHTPELTSPSTPQRSPAELEHWRSFGRWLRAARREHSHRTGLPRATIAAAAGVCDNTWGNWERGGRNMDGHWVAYRPTPKHLDTVAFALGIPAAEVRDRAAFGPLRANAPQPSANGQHVTITVVPFDTAPLYDRIAALEARLDEFTAPAG